MTDPAFSPAEPERWQPARVSWRQAWPGAGGLVSLRLDTQVAPREPGQYVQLACSDGAAWGVRYLSLASAPEAAPELLVAPATGDEEPGDPAALQVGDAVYVSRAGAGRLVAPPVAEGLEGGTLWLFAAGTGLAPLLSVVRAERHGFGRVVVVHSARSEAHLAWRAELEARPEVAYVPLITWDDTPGREADPWIDAAWQQGLIGARAGGLALDPVRDAAMVCGMAAMLASTRAALVASGLADDRVITEY